MQSLKVEKNPQVPTYIGQVRTARHCEHDSEQDKLAPHEAGWFLHSVLRTWPTCESPEIVAHLSLLASRPLPAPPVAPVTSGLPWGGGSSAQHIICEHR